MLQAVLVPQVLLAQQAPQVLRVIKAPPVLQEVLVQQVPKARLELRAVRERLAALEQLAL